MPNERGVRLHETALPAELARITTDQRTPGGLIRARIGERATPRTLQHINPISGLIVPGERPCKTTDIPALEPAGLVVPIEAGTTLYVSEATDAEGKGRSVSDFATAFAHPRRFLAGEIEKRFGEGANQSVLAHLRDEKSGYDKNDLKRIKKTNTFRNVLTGETEKTEIMAPGPVEQAGLFAVGQLDDPELKPFPEKVLIQPLKELLRNYRRDSEEYREQVPEMSELTAKLVETLDRFPIDRQVRYGIYDILDQIDMPDGQREELMLKMDQAHDLEHPLAFSTTLAIKIRQKSPWITTQRERRQALLARLDGTNQELFEQYGELLEASSGLVMASDPGLPPRGKIGLEIETNLNDYVPGSDRVEKAENARNAGLELAWTMGFDGTGNEVRKHIGSLGHGHEYLLDLVHLARWSADHGKHLKSIHIHLDRDKHPRRPGLCHMIEGVDRAGKGTLIHNYKYNTWEVRGLNLPSAGSTLHPARVDDLITMYIGATEEDNTAGEKLIIPADTTPDMLQLTWGHITTFMQDPEGRLGALMALHDKKALKNVTPLAFTNSIEQGHLPGIASALEGVFTHTEDTEVLMLMAAYGEGTLEDAWRNVTNMNVRDIFATIMPDEYRRLSPTHPGDTDTHEIEGYWSTPLGRNRSIGTVPWSSMEAAAEAEIEAEHEEWEQRHDEEALAVQTRLTRHMRITQALLGAVNSGNTRELVEEIYNDNNNGQQDVDRYNQQIQPESLYHEENNIYTQSPNIENQANSNSILINQNPEEFIEDIIPETSPIISRDSRN